MRAPALLALGALLAGCGGEAAPVEEPSSAAPAPIETVPTLQEPPPARSFRTVAVDAGHGGEDDGAHGVSGVLEKDVTLATARRLARALRARGFTVIETRTDDTTLSLPRRTEIANASGAGLLISVHANSAPGSGARGIETYSMDLASDESAMRLAERENRFDAVLSAAGGTRSDELMLVEELRHGANADWSRVLAGDVHRSLVSGTRSFYGRDVIQDRGRRAGPFWVLLDSEIPAILVEVGYLTDADEEQRVRSAAFQEQAAEAIAAGVEAWVQRAEAAEAGRPR